MINDDDAIQAAYILNDYCKEHKNCRGCVFTKDYEYCLIGDNDIGLGWPLEKLEEQQ